MENLGAMAYSRYTGFREITDRDVLELHCKNDFTSVTVVGGGLYCIHFFLIEKKKKVI